MLEGKPIILKKISDPKFEEIKKIKEPNLMLKYAKFNLVIRKNLKKFYQK